MIVKLQGPTSKLQRSSNIQIPKALVKQDLDVEAWCFSGAWSLEFGPLLLPPVFLDDLEHGACIGGFLERLAKFFFVQQLRDVRQRVQMLLELALRHEEQHDQVHRLIVQRL